VTIDDWSSHMAVDPLANAVELFSAPVEQLIVALGRGVAEAQTALDRASISTQEQIDADPTLSRFGLQATWYQMPQVELQLKLALTVAETRPTAGPAPAATVAAPIAALAVRPVHLVAQPVSAAYQNHFNYNVQAASQITLRIVPVPPARAGDQGVAPSRLSPDEARSAALASPAKFTTARDAAGNVVPAANLRFDVNYNAAARTWYVLQYDPTNPAVPAVVVTVDDTTGTVRVITT
jgi:hypothetical protein